MAIDPSLLTTRLRSFAPFADDEAARHARDATLTALRRGLTDDEADWLAIDLGPELAVPLVRGVYGGGLSLGQFFGRIASLTGLRRGLAVQQAQVVCRALTELLPPSSIARLRRCLPELAPMFALPEPEQPASELNSVRNEPRPERTLAGGKPDSGRPLCDAAPFGTAALPVSPPLSER